MKFNRKAHRSVYPKIRSKRAQQEMVGFVLIVVLVMIALMVFLVISVTSEPETSTNNKEADNLLSAVLSHTTECAIVFEPDYDDFEDLIKSCYASKTCSNLGKPACEYLKTSLTVVMSDSMATLSDINYYKLSVLEEDLEGTEGLLLLEEGNCTGSSTFGASKLLAYSSGKLYVTLELCVNN